MDTISKEIQQNHNHHNHHGMVYSEQTVNPITYPGAGNQTGSYSSIINNNIKNTSISSMSTASNQSNSIGSNNNILNKDSAAYNTQRNNNNNNIPLNDIDFPQPFMF